MIARRIDAQINLLTRNDVFVKFYCPLGLALSSFADLVPVELKEKVFFSGLEKKYIYYLVLTWKLHDIEKAKEIFGEKCFCDRPYPDSEGTIDYDNLKGGLLLYVFLSFFLFFFFSFFSFSFFLSFFLSFLLIDATFHKTEHLK